MENAAAYRRVAVGDAGAVRIGDDEWLDEVLVSLENLECRGYDSTGIVGSERGIPVVDTFAVSTNLRPAERTAR